MAIEFYSNTKHWWMFLLRGLVFMLVGVYMISAPTQSYMALSLLFGILILVTGAAELGHALTNRHSRRWKWRLVVGLIDLVLGLILIFNISLSMAVMPILVGIWLFLTGISLLTFATVIRNPMWLVIGGVLTTIVSILVMFVPSFGAVTIVIWTALAFLIAGIFNGLLAFRLKEVNDYLNNHS